jgi:hypothetical protein
MTPRERILKVLLRILTNPHKYSRPELARYFNETERNINKDTEIINALPEITLHYKEHPYKCYIEPNNKYSELNKFLPLNEDDRYHLKRALDYLALPLANLLQTKIEGLYDFQQLGLRQLRHPAIEKINRLEAAKNQEKKVILNNYRSNQSNQTKDRLVEPHLINPELDTLQAYDYFRNKSIHFRLSRIERVESTDQDWEYKQRHSSQNTDVFRIANNDQVQVKLRLQVRAYNILIESFPMAKNYLDPDSEPDHFIFQAQVNKDFFGLMPFIMGFNHFIEILGPAELKDAVKEEARKILEK